MSGSKCCFLTCIQLSKKGSKVVCYSHLLKNCPQFVVIHTVKGFSIVSEADCQYIILILFIFREIINWDTIHLWNVTCESWIPEPSNPLCLLFWQNHTLWKAKAQTYIRYIYFGRQKHRLKSIIKEWERQNLYIHYKGVREKEMTFGGVKLRPSNGVILGASYGSLDQIAKGH